jgi:hypothetical protein
VVQVELPVGIALAMAILGTVLAGDALRTWYPSLHHLSFEPLVWGWVLVGLVERWMGSRVADGDAVAALVAVEGR